MMSMQASLKALTLQIDSTEKVPNEVIGDKLRLQQVLINLVQNAITHTTEGIVQIQVMYDYSKQMLEVNVIDTGIGIKPEDQDKIF